MGRRTTRRPRREPQGPSRFFIIALGIGLLLFFLFFAMILRKPPTTQPAAKKTTVLMEPVDQPVISGQWRS